MIRSDILFASLWQIKKGCHALAVPPDDQNKIARDKSLELSLSSFHREPTLASYRADNKGKILKSQEGVQGVLLSNNGFKISEIPNFYSKRFVKMYSLPSEKQIDCAESYWFPFIK